MLSVNEVNEPVPYVALILNINNPTFKSHGKYRKSYVLECSLSIYADSSLIVYLLGMFLIMMVVLQSRIISSGTITKLLE